MALLPVDDRLAVRSMHEKKIVFCAILLYGQTRNHTFKSTIATKWSIQQFSPVQMTLEADTSVILCLPVQIQKLVNIFRE